MKGFIGNTSSIRMLNGTRLVAYTSAVCLFAFVTLLAFPVTSASEEAIATTGTALPSTTTLTLSSSNDYASVNVAPNSAQGTFAVSDASGTAGFSVTTNNFTGYTLSIASSDDAGRLENYTHDYISSISSNLSEADFSGANNTTYNNKWGFKPNSYVSNNTVVDNTGNNAVFLPSPTTKPTVLNVTSAANTTDDEYTLGLGIRADLLLPSGVYSKTLNLIALANVVSYTISFDKNTADMVTNMPSAVSGTTSATGITIPNTTPTRTDYTFEGWCDVVSPTGQCDGNAFQPGGTFGIDQTTSNDTTLYAVWKPVRNMQNVYSWMNDLSINDSVQAKDTRDGKVYWVTKLETDPGNPRAMIDESTGKSYQIWMTQNLSFNIDETKTYTHEDTDLGYATNNPVTTWTPTAGHSTFDIDDTWISDNNMPYSVDLGEMYYYTSNTSDNDVLYTSLESCIEAGNSRINCEHYNTGYYYNWSAAVASNDTSALVNFGDKAADSICPAGWTLPSGNYPGSSSRTDFATLIYANGVSDTLVTDGNPVQYPSDGFNKLRESPLWIVRAGSNLSPSTRGSDAIYWTNIVSNTSDKAVSLGLTNTVISPNNHSAVRYAAFPVRCVVRPTMQGATVDYLEEMLPGVGDTMILTDERDGKDYPITRIDDNNFWMTSNLDLAGGTTITPADSNVASNYTLPVSSEEGFDSSSIANVFNSGSTSCGDHSPCYSYYNYAAVTAGTNPTSGDAEYDICPKGWRLPTNNDFLRLAQYYPSDDSMILAPWNGVVAGDYGNGELRVGGARGNYWSSTANDNNAGEAYAMFYIPNNAYATGTYTQNYMKARGDSVRCIIKKPYMQDYSHSDLVSELPNTGDARDLYDARDGKKYSVTNINGTIWMTTNLDLAGGTTLTAADSNVVTSYTLPASSMSGFDDASVANVYNSGSTTCGDNSPCYSYYNFAAATAGTNPGSGESIYDICPKGWRLPGYSDYENAANISSSLADSLNNTLSGRYSQSQLEYGGEYGYYWLSTTSSSNNYTRRVIASNGGVFSDSDYRYRGNSVRCVAKQYMQDITPATCPTTPTTVTDIRDGELYTIQRLEDDNCWLLDNLRLDLTDANVQNNLTADTTNASNTTLNYLKNGGGTASDQYATAGVAAWGSSNSYSAPLINTASKDTTGAGGYAAGKYGVYYNYCAASAGSYCYGDGTSAGTSSGDATEDICPKGWRMPTGGESGEYQALYTAYSRNYTNFVNALHTPLSGFFFYGYASYQGEYGRFSSSTRNSNDSVYISIVGTSNVSSQDYDRRSLGYSVRCVLNTSIPGVTTMQQFGSLDSLARSDVIDSMTVGQAYTITDTRDNESYSIAKLADGKVWLLDNLRLDLTNASVQTNLTSSTTNASDATLGYLKNGGGTTSDQYATAGVAALGSSNSYSAPLINTDYKDDTGTGGYEAGKYGVYYNYCAASAGSYCYGDGTSSGSPSGNATEDICPKGWRMPTGGFSGEYLALYTAYNSAYADLVNALHTPLSGYFYNGSASNQGSRGYFWSSTRFSDYDMYILNVTTSSVGSWSTSIRDRGFSVRCILQ